MQVLVGVSVDIDVILISDVPIALCIILTDEEVAPWAPYLETNRVFINAAMERAEEFKRESSVLYEKTTWTPVSFQEIDGRSNCGFVPYSQYINMYTTGFATNRNSVKKVDVTTLDGEKRQFLCECVKVIENPVIASVMFYLQQNVTGPGTLSHLTRQRMLFLFYSYAKSLVFPCRRHGGTCA